MGTRSLTVFQDDDGKEIAVLYRQHDGYPEGHGKALKEWLDGKRLCSGIRTRDSKEEFNGMSCLAAWTVANFKKEIGGFYLYPAGTRECDEEYIYTVYQSKDDPSKIMLKVEECYTPKKVIFDGPVSEFDPEAKVESN